MTPHDKEELRFSLSSWNHKHQTQFTLKSVIRIARELKNHVGNEFIADLETEYEGEYGLEELKKI